MSFIKRKGKKIRRKANHVRQNQAPKMGKTSSLDLHEANCDQHLSACTSSRWTIGRNLGGRSLTVPWAVLNLLNPWFIGLTRWMYCLTVQEIRSRKRVLQVHTKVGWAVFLPEAQTENVSLPFPASRGIKQPLACDLASNRITVSSASRLLTLLSSSWLKKRSLWLLWAL